MSVVGAGILKILMQEHQLAQEKYFQTVMMQKQVDISTITHSREL